MFLENCSFEYFSFSERGRQSHPTAAARQLLWHTPAVRRAAHVCDRRAVGALAAGRASPLAFPYNYTALVALAWLSMSIGLFAGVVAHVYSFLLYNGAGVQLYIPSRTNSRQRYIGLLARVNACVKSADMYL
jgi:hypothetical protein